MNEKIKGIPVIVVSAKVGVEDKVSLLLGGAEDYITKPFSTKELLARVQVQLRKAGISDKNGICNIEAAYTKCRTGNSNACYRSHKKGRGMVWLTKNF